MQNYKVRISLAARADMAELRKFLKTMMTEEGAVRKALTERLLAEQSQAKAKAQQQMVKDSLTRAFDELHSGRIHRDARKLFDK